MSEAESRFHPADPDSPGWLLWQAPDPTRFNRAVLGKVNLRAEGPDQCRVRLIPQRHHTNTADNIHGGITMALIDVGMFAAMSVLRGVSPRGAMTLGITTQFIAAGNPAQPLDAVVEVLRETRRMGFLRGLVEQEGGIVAAFSGTVRKPGSRTPAPA